MIEVHMTTEDRDKEETMEGTKWKYDDTKWNQAHEQQEKSQTTQTDATKKIEVTTSTCGIKESYTRRFPVARTYSFRKRIKHVNYREDLSVEELSTEESTYADDIT